MFQFKDLIKTGKASAGEVEQNRQGIDEVFAALNKELKEETQGLVTVVREVNKSNALLEMAKTYSLVSKGLASPVTIEKNSHAGTLDIAFRDDMQAAVARWEQHPDGYPFTIEFLGERTDCWDQQALANTLGKMVSSGQFWLKVKELESGFQNASAER